MSYVLPALNTSKLQQEQKSTLLSRQTHFSLMFLGMVFLEVLFFTFFIGTKKFKKDGIANVSFYQLPDGYFSHLATRWNGSSLTDIWPILVIAFLIFSYFALIAIYTLRAQGEMLNVRFFFSRLTNQAILKKYLIISVVAVGFVGAVLGVTFIAGFGVKWVGIRTGLFELKESAAIVGIMLIIFTSFMLALVSTLIMWFKHRRFVEVFEKANATYGDNLLLLCNMQGIHSVTRCISIKANLLSNYADNRSFSSLLMSVVRIGVPPNLPVVSGIRSKAELVMLRKCLQQMEDRLQSSTSSPG